MAGGAMVWAPAEESLVEAKATTKAVEVDTEQEAEQVVDVEETEKALGGTILQKK
jgi:hypothetical protein